MKNSKTINKNKTKCIVRKYCYSERPYKCHLPECGRAFIQLSNLQQHLRNHDAQIERAKNRPFHCNICGKGFATESSLRTHTSKELQLHLGVLQQHAALIGGPNATSCPICHKLFIGGEALMEHMKHTHKDPNASGVATKRRSANHPCPVCGKHYVNEGSLRKHLACHPETQQLASSLRMWPCSVCQAVFTHEGGLLTHMEHMRMDPKHQFAAQYVLSRAAAERRDRGGQNSMCASPSAQSDTSSNNERLSSAGSEGGGGAGSSSLLNNNNNNNCNNKLSVNDVLRATSNNGHLHNQYGVDEMHANRMAVMAAAANIVNQSATNANGQPNLNSPTPDSSAAAVQAAVVNLAAAMRMNQVANQNLNNGNTGNNGPSSTTPPNNNDATNAAAQAMLRVSMADTMMSMNHQQHHHQHQQNTPEAAIRMQQQAEAILRTQAEALRLVSQAAAVAASSGNNGGNNNPNVHHNGNNYGGATNNHPGNQSGNNQQVHQQNQSHSNNPQQTPGGQQQNQLNSQVSPELSEALRLHEQRLEQALRLQGSDPRSLGFPLSSQTAQHNP
uniref:CSON002873 protein n=1 Tax=Culicoides sonorensis TaxID=179676 RepID=A0A336L4C6_CULSO